MGRPSLRTRLVLGSILWTVGLTAVVNVASLAFVLHFHNMRLAHWSLMTLVAIGLLVAALWQVNAGLSPLLRLRARLAALRQGREERVGGEYPSEVQPLVDDLNALLDDRDERVARALAKAGDFAHGLKTPLAVLAQEAERLVDSGDRERADALFQQIERMRRQTEHHLAHARAAASRATPQARCRVAESADALARTMLRLHTGRGLSLRVTVPPDLEVRVHRADLDEMLGNLLDNACKWGRSRVAVEAGRVGDAVRITVDDDGPGIEPTLRGRVLERGVRADEAAPGSGFGLAIVRDLTEVYGGSIALEGSPEGGLRALLTLPSAAG